MHLLPSLIAYGLLRAGFLTAIQRSFTLSGENGGAPLVNYPFSFLVAVITMYLPPAGIIGYRCCHRVQEKTTEQGIIPMISYVLYAWDISLQMLLCTLPILASLSPILQSG